MNLTSLTSWNSHAVVPCIIHKAWRFPLLCRRRRHHRVVYQRRVSDISLIHTELGNRTVVDDSPTSRKTWFPGKLAQRHMQRWTCRDGIPYSWYPDRNWLVRRIERDIRPKNREKPQFPKSCWHNVNWLKDSTHLRTTRNKIMIQVGCAIE
jgi:hypothetical protein